MRQFNTIFYWGMFISFLGSLPPGLINLAALQISGRQGTDAAMIYALGSMLAEVIVVRISLSGMNWMMKRRRFFSLLEWMTAGLLIVFSVACFIAASSMKNFTTVLPNLLLPPFITGVLLSALNPLHIPFWLGWSTVLMNKGVLRLHPLQYNQFVLGIGIGTIAGFIVFIFGEQYLLDLFRFNNYLLNYGVGSILLVVAFFHIRKMIRVPVAVRYSRIWVRK